MEYRPLGGSGLQVSAVGLGGNSFGQYCDERRTCDIVHCALDLGVNHIDTADLYSRGVSECFVGKAIAGRRHDVVLATKTGFPLGDGPNDVGLSYGRLIACCEKSLRRLGTDYVDVYYLHRPDPRTPLEETLRAVADLRCQGKVRYVGISNHPAWQVCQALWVSDRRGYPPPVVSQSPYNLLDRGIEAELLPLCREFCVGIVPYSPLAGGFLTGKYRPGEPPPAGVRGHNNPRFAQQLTARNFELLGRLESFARARDRSVGDLAVAWLLSHDEVCSVIAGATSTQQVAANVAAGAWRLGPAELSEIAAILAR
jgi:aryl-alcohol dehydrogenase-like predicted oxidoreductase